MGIDLGGNKVGVAEEFLDAAEIGAGIEQVGGIAVTQLVRRELRVQTGQFEIALQAKSWRISRPLLPASAFCRSFSAMRHASKRSASSGVSNGGRASNSVINDSISCGVVGQGSPSKRTSSSARLALKPRCC